MGTVFVDNIKHQSAQGSGTITLGASGETVAVASGATNNLGITQADQWRLTANITANADPISANLERVDNTGFGYIGTGMSVSSGIWTFPSTGLWKIEVNMTATLGGADVATYIELQQQISGVATTVSAATVGSSGDYDSSTATFLYNVTDTSTRKFSFRAISMSSSTIYGDTNLNYTAFTFIRLGDSV